MKVFLDTNIFLEYFEQRREYQAVDKLLSAVEDGKLKDYRNTDTAKMEILSPTEFVEKFL